jgi:competence protein ComEC
VAPGAFDFGRRAYFQRIGGYGFAFGGPTLLTKAEETDFAQWLAELRQSIAARVWATLPGDRGAIAAALMVGQRGAISDAALEAMRDAGLAHLLAISGLHMGLAAGWLFLLVRGLLALLPRIALYYPIKKWAALAAAAGALFYLGLAGAPIPTIRAFIMVTTVLAAVLLDRRALSLRLVAWAAFLVLLLLPESLVSVSFQLSFAAVVALIAVYERLAFRGWSRAAEASWPGRTAIYIGSVALTSLIASLATAPFAAYHFNRLVLYGVLANLLAVPLTAFWIMPWALAALLLMPFGWEQLALVPMGWGIAWLLAIAEAVAAWPGAFLAIKAMPLTALLAFTFGGLWLAIWQRPWRYARLGLLAAGLLFTVFSRTPDVWVNDDGRLFGVKGDDGRLYLSSRRVGRFDAEIWQRRAALAEQAGFPADGAALNGSLRCDPLACLYRHAGQVVAFVKDPRALWDDCPVATALISQEPVRPRSCPEPEVMVDRFDLWRAGAASLTLDPQGIRLRTVRAERGERPWVLQRGWAQGDESE